MATKRLRTSPSGRTARLVTVVGARPQFIKASAVTKAINRHNAREHDRHIEEVLIHTGQHYDDEMSAVFFRELGLPDPAHHIGVGSDSHGRQTGEMLKNLDAVLGAEAPDMVLVYGDTNSTLAGALSAAKLNLKVAHVEAGLRSYRRDMPEEINRVLTDHLSSTLFCPSRTAVSNLAREGITEGVSIVGDVMYDVLRGQLPAALRHLTLLDELGVQAGAYGLATIHRAENTDDPQNLEAILSALSDLSRDGLPIVLPLHPRTAARLEDRQYGPDIRVTKPVSYEEMLCLEQHAQVILTDSGGVQKEAYWLGVPCITLRDESEWPETVETGWNTLTGAVPDRIRLAVAAAIGIDKPRPPVYGTGDASNRIVAELDRAFHGPT